MLRTPDPHCRHIVYDSGMESSPTAERLTDAWNALVATRGRLGGAILAAIQTGDERPVIDLYEQVLVQFRELRDAVTASMDTITDLISHSLVEMLTEAKP